MGILGDGSGFGSGKFEQGSNYRDPLEIDYHTEITFHQ